MTHDDLQLHAIELVKNLSLASSEKSEAQLILEALSDVAKRVQEEDCKAVCHLCEREGIPAWSDERGYKHSNERSCRAVDIFEMEDSLVSS